MPRSSRRLTGGQSVERQIELQHVHARLAQEPEPAPFEYGPRRAAARGLPAGCAPWQRAAPGTRRASGEMCGSSPLAEVVTRSIGTEAEGFSFLSVSMSPCTRSSERLVGRTEIGAAELPRCRAPKRSWSNRRGPARSSPTDGRGRYLSLGEHLADQRGADHLAVLLDQAALGLGRKDDFGNAGHRQRIGQAGDQREARRGRRWPDGFRAT